MFESIIGIALRIPESSSVPGIVWLFGSTSSQDSAEVVGRVASACAEAKQWQTVLGLLEVWRWVA